MKRKHSHKNGKKARRSKDKSRKKASFKSNAKGPGLKRADYKPKDATVYKGYDISALPKEAWPDETKTNAGKQSYTLTHKDCAIEVLLKHNAFFVKRVGGKGLGPTGQVSFAKHGGVKKAWRLACIRAGFPQSFHAAC